jgi:hypothetical protein
MIAASGVATSLTRDAVRVRRISRLEPCKIALDDPRGTIDAKSNAA